MPNSDVKYIEGLRKLHKRFSPLRWITVSIHLAIVVGVVWLGFDMLEEVKGRVKFLPRNLQLEEVWLIGAVMGMALGGALWSSFKTLLLLIFGCKTEQMLVQYFDAYQAMAASEKTT